MAPLIHLDTHVAAWLYAGRVDLFPAAVQKVLNESDLRLSPMAIVELQYLYEIRRTEEPARQVMEVLGQKIGLEVCDLPFARVAEIALDQAWTRDPFDRFIVSQALLAEAPLLTKDRNIREHHAAAFWRSPTLEPPVEP